MQGNPAAREATAVGAQMQLQVRGERHGGDDAVRPVPSQLLCCGAGHLRGGVGTA